VDGRRLVATESSGTRGEPRLIVAAAIIVLLLDGDQITCNNEKDGRWIVEDAGW
jgi:hypothetical protein